MIITGLSDAVFYRMNTPRWAYSPTSGAGAARQGGRLNRAGVEALYLSKETDTAVAEFRQTSTILPPGMLVSYLVSAARVVDFSAGFHVGWDPLWQDFDCDWRKLVFNDEVEPPTWVLSDMVIAAGCQSVLFPSLARPGGTNVVIYPAMLAPQDKLEVIDPNNDLPRDQSSWK